MQRNSGINDVVIPLAPDEKADDHSSEGLVDALSRRMSASERFRRMKEEPEQREEIRAIAVRKCGQDDCCTCDEQKICSHDFLMPLRSKEEKVRIFWDNLVRLEHIRLYGERKLASKPQHWLFAGLPCDWINEYVGEEPEDRLYRKIDSFRKKELHKQRERILKEYGMFRTREVTVSAVVLQRLGDTTIDDLFEGCIAIELYSAGIIVSMSQSQLENTYTELSKISKHLDRDAKLGAMIGFLQEPKKQSIVEAIHKYPEYSFKQRKERATLDALIVDRVLLDLKGPREIHQRERKVMMLNEIKNHAQGGYSNQNIWLKSAARLYVVIALGLAILVAVINLGKRDSWLEQIFDSLQVMSFLLIGVFGIVKLTSEDESVLKHTFEGVKLLKRADDVMKHVGCQDRTELKQLLMETEENQWLDPSECSFTRNPCTGTIKLLGGLTVREIIESGNFVISDRLIFKKDLDEEETLGRWINRIRVSNFHAESGNAWVLDFAEGNVPLAGKIL